jgi:hypothetical protein
MADDEMRDLRDRIIRAEGRIESHGEEIKGLKKMVWAPIWLVLGAVGAALMKMLGIGQ